jgi:hypothetical protein
MMAAVTAFGIIMPLAYPSISFNGRLAALPSFATFVAFGLNGRNGQSVRICPGTHRRP